MKKSFSVVVICLVLLFGRACFAGFSYSVTEISAPDSTTQVFPNAINDTGEVVGTEAQGVGRAPFLFSNGVLINLIAGTSVTSGDTRAINGNGDVAENIGTPTTPAILSKGKLNTLPTLGHGGAVVGDNDAGTWVGYVSVNGQMQAASWDDGKLNVLSGVPGVSSNAFAVNNSGEIVGLYETASGDFHAFSWMNGKIGTFGLDSYTMSGANDINDKGDVVGAGHDPKGNFVEYAVISDRVVPLVPLGGTSTGNTAGGVAINDADQIVGTSMIDQNGDSRAVLYQNGKTIDLNTEINPKLGDQLQQGIDINNRGQILAMGTAGGRQVGFILTPQAIPLPASLWMGLTTLPLLGIALRRKRCAVT